MYVFCTFSRLLTPNTDMKWNQRFIIVFLYCFNSFWLQHCCRQHPFITLTLITNTNLYQIFLFALREYKLSITVFYVLKACTLLPMPSCCQSRHQLLYLPFSKANQVHNRKQKVIEAIQRVKGHININNLIPVIINIKIYMDSTCSVWKCSLFWGLCVIFFWECELKHLKADVSVSCHYCAQTSHIYSS